MFETKMQSSLKPNDKFNLTELMQEKNISKQKIILSNFIKDLLIKIIGDTEKVNWEETDNFFDYGMDSMSSLHFASILTQKLGLNFSSSVLYEFPTIKQLVDFLHQKVSNNTFASL